jgi:hypothetical protein
MLEGSDRIVFIHFVPGSFGSFLLHCLSYSDSVFLQNKKDIFFDEFGAAHYKIKQFFLDFHSGTRIYEWSNLPTEMQKTYLEKNWNPPEDFLNSNLHYIHRIVLPKKIELVKQHIPKARHIKITIPFKYNLLVRDMLIKKTGNVPNITYSYIKNNDTIEGVYDFDISHFVEGTFLSEFDKLCEWLNFEKTDVSSQYEKFKQANEFI